MSTWIRYNLVSCGGVSNYIYLQTKGMKTTRCDHALKCAPRHRGPYSAKGRGSLSMSLRLCLRSRWTSLGFTMLSHRLDRFGGGMSTTCGGVYSFL